MSWDNKPSGVGSSVSSYGSNDWSDSTLMQVLNDGAYWNRRNGVCPSGKEGTTSNCDFSEIGLTENSRNMIGETVWNLGGTYSQTTALAINWYNFERGSTVSNGRNTYWIGKIGLMYPSDYGYATSGGAGMNRESCLNTSIYSWNNWTWCGC